MDPLDVSRRTSPVMTNGLDHSEELLADVDEPPDERHFNYSPPQLQTKTHSSPFSKAMPPQYARRESLLTRQLYSETEHTEDEDHQPRLPVRGLSNVSTWSNPSTASTAELTSDDGKSVTSPTVSPPLPPTHIRSSLPILEKPLNKEPTIVGHEDDTPKPSANAPEKTVEAGLGRRRCITFACGRKDKEAMPVTLPKEEEKAVSPPKRKCMLKFACPSRGAAESKPLEAPTSRRTTTPPPMQRKASAPRAETKPHRGSDATVTHASPKASRKSPPAALLRTRKLSEDSEAGATEATRFHEFGTSEDEPEEWTQENTCHRTRLTVADTLKKEIAIRKIGEEAEEEALEDDADELDEDVDDAVELDEDGDDDAENDDVEEDEDEDDEADDRSEDAVSDAGFQTDDEDGFARSDSESDGSENEWWTPAALSTAATSAEHLDHLVIRPAARKSASDSSIGSISSGHMSPRASRRAFHHETTGRSRKVGAMTILRPGTPELPDSTDFVCGTLDEDRPLEKAYISCVKQREAAKHVARPQDIDPTFPTSDPEMDEEDDEDIEDPEESEDDLMHGSLEELHGAPEERSRRRSFGLYPRPQIKKAVLHRSPPPPTRHRSPPPTRRTALRSPAPTKRMMSPPPAKRTGHRSPPPPAKRNAARSPPPRKLFGNSPRRMRSPAPMNRMTSPPNSPSAHIGAMAIAPSGLGHRPQLTHTTSLPRGGLFMLNASAIPEDDESEVTTVEVPKRGAIDIVKGLERKRQRRKEKLYQKHCAKAGKEKAKDHKVKPGKGAERMREVGLELARYRGTGEHILSI